MVVSEIIGGVGNQMFQYAMGRKLAIKNNDKLLLNIELFRNYPLREYELNKFNICEEYPSEKYAGTQLSLIYEGTVEFHPEALSLPDNIYIRGYWQCEKYFKDIRSVLLKDFTLKEPLKGEGKKWLEKIKNSKCPVALTTRRGDYTTPENAKHFGLCSPHYYAECIKQMQEKVGDFELFIFPDDMEWIKENIKCDMPTHYITGVPGSAERVYLMTCCKHHIVSNSTFCWWGAWLCDYDDKLVYAPTPWLDCKRIDIIPENWIKLEK